MWRDTVVKSNPDYCVKAGDWIGIRMRLLKSSRTVNLRSQPGRDLIMSTEPSIYEIRDVPGQGVGLFATRDIAVGELVIAETALFTAMSPHSILSKASTLDESRKEQMMALRDNYSPDLPNAITIFKTNALPLGAGALEAGLFPIISRINNSCLPNVHHSFNSDLGDRGQETVYAILPIQAGEEILTTYADPGAPRSERQAGFRSRFKFECGCKICSGPPNPASDARRKKIADLDTLIPQIASRDPVGAFRHAKERLRYLDAEGLADQCVQGATHYDAFQACSFASDYDMGKREAGLAYGGTVVGEGLTGKGVAQFARYYRSPRQHPAAGLGRRMKMPNICDACGCVSKITCRGCDCALYCDEACQKEHAKWHEPICHAIQRFGQK